MRLQLNVLQEIIIMNQNNEYFVNFNKEELLNKNVVVAKTSIINYLY